MQGTKTFDCCKTEINTRTEWNIYDCSYNLYFPLFLYTSYKLMTGLLVTCSTLIHWRSCEKTNWNNIFIHANMVMIAERMLVNKKSITKRKCVFIHLRKFYLEVLLCPLSYWRLWECVVIYHLPNAIIPTSVNVDIKTYILKKNKVPKKKKKSRPQWKTALQTLCYSKLRELASYQFFNPRVISFFLFLVSHDIWVTYLASLNIG